jgi:hypothetical protein
VGSKRASVLAPCCAKPPSTHLVPSPAKELSRARTPASRESTQSWPWLRAISPARRSSTSSAAPHRQRDEDGSRRRLTSRSKPVSALSGDPERFPGEDEQDGPHSRHFRLDMAGRQNAVVGADDRSARRPAACSLGVAEESPDRSPPPTEGFMNSVVVGCSGNCLVRRDRAVVGGLHGTRRRVHNVPAGWSTPIRRLVPGLSAGDGAEGK